MPTALKEVYLALDALIRSDKSRSELLQLGGGHGTEEERSLEFCPFSSRFRMGSVLRRVVDVDHLPLLLREAIASANCDMPCESSDESDIETESDESENVDAEKTVNVESFPIVLSDMSSDDSSEYDESPMERVRMVDEMHPMEKSVRIEFVIREASEHPNENGIALILDVMETSKDVENAAEDVSDRMADCNVSTKSENASASEKITMISSSCIDIKKTDRSPIKVIQRTELFAKRGFEGKSMWKVNEIWALFFGMSF